MHKEFEVHLLNSEGIKRAKRIATLFDDFLTQLELINPFSTREMEIVRTKLEEASFFSKKDLANDPEYQEENS